MDIICKSMETAIESLASWYRFEEADIINLLKKDYCQTYISSGANHEVPFDRYLYKQMPFKTDDSWLLPRVHWFHGTRCISKCNFDIGLLPLGPMMPKIQQELDGIAGKHKILKTNKTTGIGRHSGILIENKLASSINHGPCAVLNYEALKSPEMFGFHSYTDIPEFVEDYAYACYGKHAEKLLNIYRSISQPAIVEFWSIPDDSANPQMDRIAEAILTYAYAMMHPEQDLIGIMCNTCYSGYGKPVPPERIVAVTML